MPHRLNTSIYIFSRFFLSTSDSLYVFAVGFWILSHTGSAVLFALNGIIAVLVSLISLPVIGVFSDSKNNRKIILLNEFIYSTILLIIFLYFLLFEMNIVVIYFATAILTFSNQFADNSFQTAFTQLFDEEKIQKVYGYNSMVLSVSDIAGPILGGLLYGLLGLKFTILILAIFAFVSFISDYFLKFDDKDVMDYSDEQSFIVQIKDGFSYIKNEPTIKRLMIFSAALGFSSASVFIYPRTILIDYYEMSPEALGVFSAIVGLGSILGGLIFSLIKQKDSPLRMIKISSVLIGFLFIILSIPVMLDFSTSNAYLTFISIGLLITLMMQFSNIPLMTYYQLNIKEELKGRVFALMGVLSMTFMPLGMLLFSILLDAGLYISVNFVFGLIIVGSTVLTLRKVYD